ncbi:MAG TPA: hypothetical protein VFZ61_22340 [Polyangiales bacterium]
MNMNTKALIIAALCSAGAGSWSGCGGDDDPQEVGEEDAGGGHSHEDEDAGHSHGEPDSGAGEADAEVPEKPARYAIATQVFGANDQTSYLVLHEGDLFQSKIGIEGGVERAGRALAVAGPESGSVFYAGDKLPDVDRFDVTGGKLAKSDSVSFGGEGVASIAEYPGQLVMVSATKALYFDSRTLKVIVWNPAQMTVTKAIDVSALSLMGYSAAFSTVTATKGGKVFMPVGYRTPAAVPSQTAVVVVDTAMDTAEVVKDTRCGYVRDAVEGDDGQWYLATEAFASAVHYLNSKAAPAPCLLRFDLETSRFDPDFKVDLNELADGKPVGSLVKLPNGKFYTRVLDEKLVPQMAMPSGRAVASARAWGWSEITLGEEPTLSDVPGAYVMGGSLVPQQLGDTLVVPDFSADMSKTTLCDMSNGPKCDVKTEVQGLVFSVALIED